MEEGEQGEDADEVLEQEGAQVVPGENADKAEVGRGQVVNRTSDRLGVVWEGPHEKAYLSGLSSTVEYATEAEAKEKCVKLNVESQDQRRCSGITLYRGSYTLRATYDLNPSPHDHETSWVLRTGTESAPGLGFKPKKTSAALRYTNPPQPNRVFEPCNRRKRGLLLLANEAYYY